MSKNLDICPISLAEANRFVEEHHRHHKPVVGHKFSIGCTDGENIVGVAIVGRPVSRHLDDGLTLEVNRLATDRKIVTAIYTHEGNFWGDGDFWDVEGKVIAWRYIMPPEEEEPDDD